MSKRVSSTGEEDAAQDQHLFQSVIEGSRASEGDSPSRIEKTNYSKVQVAGYFVDLNYP